MKNERIETPMYFVDGFAEGTEKQFPDELLMFNEKESEIRTIKEKTISFLKSSGKKIKKVEEARQAIYDDPTLNESAKAVNMYKQAEKRIDEIQEQAENLPDIASYAQNLDSEINSTIEEMANSDFGRETRQRIASMEEKDRATFVSRAIQNENYKVAAYVVGAPSFLSGIPDKAHSELKQKYKKSAFSNEMEALEALGTLHDNVQKGLKATNKLKRNIRAKASLNDAIDKSEKAKQLMEG